MDPNDNSDDAILVYKNLKDIMELYDKCPYVLRGQKNYSGNFVQSIDVKKTISSKFDRVDKLIQFVHFRMEEKFKGYREAFRMFDKNFDGSLNFREFMTGLSSIGVNLNMPDYRLIFEFIDYDEAGDISFFKFCLLDFEKIYKVH
eukprot:CAMPEP_0116872698 /NCGR_PEP_ID=MMETSP0463-20121206/3524_1 /TAXON_ID=181622 /ORGANISM="Strombidinopsis sp, Strain SopsisLIS2011" /LENGTH=144 /DNA_ID=CAMNT_0004513331 /DNA_START=125 /DNA_END=559 /DNA_ORIENTATION=-